MSSSEDHFLVEKPHFESVPHQGYLEERGDGYGGIWALKRAQVLKESRVVTVRS